MPKYKIIRQKYTRGYDGNITVSTFKANNNLEAILKVDDHCGYGYYDENGKTYKDRDFKAPTLKTALNHLYENNGDGMDAIYRIENLNSGEIIFEEDNEISTIIEKEENW